MQQAKAEVEPKSETRKDKKHTHTHTLVCPRVTQQIQQTASKAYRTCGLCTWSEANSKKSRNKQLI